MERCARERPSAVSTATQSRREIIVRRLIQDNEVSVGELALLLGVSPATVRRDLQMLHQQGLLARTHGGAAPIQQQMYESFPLDSSFEEQVRHEAEAKRRIGLAAAEMVEDGDVIGFTPGTTTAQVARSIRQRSDITLLVTTVNVAMELSNRHDLTVFVPGGFLRPSWFSLVGDATVRAIQEFYLDKVFLGVNGIDARKGLSSENHEEAAVNRALIEQARKRIVVADHTKLGMIAKAVFCPTVDVHVLITDAQAPDEMIAPFTALGIEVMRV